MRSNLYSNDIYCQNVIHYARQRYGKENYHCQLENERFGRAYA